MRKYLQQYSLQEYSICYDFLLLQVIYLYINFVTHGWPVIEY
jgi:hypothetical protein